MAKKYTGVDVTPWKLVKGNKTVATKGDDNKPFNGFKAAAEAATKLGGVPVRA